MTARPLVLLGAGEHARVVGDAAIAAGWAVVGYAAPQPADRTPGAAPAATGEWLGDDAALVERLGSTDPGARPALVLGFGAAAPIRRAAADRFGPDIEWATVVHPAAWVSPSATLGPGAVVLAAAVVNTGARLGRHAIVNSGAVVEHDVVLGDFVHVAPGAVLGGGAVIGAGVHVGIGAAVRDHLTVGDGALVGMGAVVVGDVAPGAVVMGNPARATRTAGG